MTSNRKKNKAPAIGVIEKKRQIKAVAVVGVPPKEIDTSKLQDTKWILYYKASKNAFPNNLADKILKSGTNSGIINSKKTLTAGNGLIFNDKEGEEKILSQSEEDYTDEVNSTGESLEELYELSAFDYIGWGAAYIEGVRVDKRVFYFHVDVTEVRLGNINKDGVIEKAWISPDWVAIGNSRSLDSDQKNRLKEIDLYDGSNKQPRFLLRLKRSFPGLKYYGTPDYIASVLSGWVDINYRIGKHNIDNFDNGFMPSGILNLFGEPPDGMTSEQWMKELISKFTGEGNNAKLLVQLLDNPDQAAVLNLFEQIKDGDFQILDNMSDQQLVTAHGWYRSLTGLAQPGKLGNTEQIRDEFDLAMNMKVIPDYRKPLNRFYNKMLRIANQDIKVDVQNLKPLSLSNDIEVNKVMTVNEGRKEIGLSELLDINDDLDPRGEELIDLEDREKLPEDASTNTNTEGV